jgi:hypothetical protein
MPYIRRDESGEIEAIFERPEDGATEKLAADSPEIISFIYGPNQGQWLQSDLALARVLEDLILILVHKDIISLSDLPQAAQQKLIDRRGLRKELNRELGYMADMLLEPDEEIPL